MLRSAIREATIMSKEAEYSRDERIRGAALELYEALRELLAAGNDIIEQAGKHGTPEYDAATERNSAAWKAARAALNKADGK